MIRRFLSIALLAGLASAISIPSAHAFDPGFGFAYGYSVGQANSFRNRLPTPPYFSVYPPVYYGQRYERPYGESPFASWPLLQSSPDYQARTKQSPIQIVNPHAHQATPCVSCEKPVAQALEEVSGKMVTIVNPYVVQQAVATVDNVND